MILETEIDEVKRIFANEMQDFLIASIIIYMRSDVSNTSNHSQEESKQMSEAYLYSLIYLKMSFMNN